MTINTKFYFILNMSETEYLVLSEKLAGMTTLINSQFINVNEKLDDVNDHLKKLNGKVAEHEKRLNTGDDADKVHALTCPQLPRIIDLETNKKIGLSKRQFILAIISILVMVTSIAYSSIKINEAMRVKDMNTVLKSQLEVITNQDTIKFNTK